jgi:hypothetical protein
MSSYLEMRDNISGFFIVVDTVELLIYAFLWIVDKWCKLQEMQKS